MMEKIKEIEKMKKAIECKICNKIGASIIIYLDKGGKFPEEVNKLEIITDGDNEIVRKCPECGNYYLHKYEDNSDVIPKLITNPDEIWAINNLILHDLISESIYRIDKSDGQKLERKVKSKIP